MKAKILIWLKYNWLTYRKWIWLILAFLCVLTGAYLAGRLSTRQERINQNSNILALTSDIQASEVTIDGLKNSVHEKQAIILSQANAIRDGVIERELLKKLHIRDLVTNTELNGTIRVLRDSLKLPGKPIFITVKDTSGIASDYIRVPFQLLKYSDIGIDSLNAGMNKDRSAWFSLSVPFKGSVTVGYKKAGLFKTKPVGVFLSDNPYIKISDMQTVIIKENKSIFSKWWFHCFWSAVLVEGLNIALKK